MRPTTTRRIANSQADKNSSQCIFHVLSYFTDRIAVLDSMVQFALCFRKQMNLLCVRCIRHMLNAHAMVQPHTQSMRLLDS